MNCPGFEGENELWLRKIVHVAKVKESESAIVRPPLFLKFCSATICYAMAVIGNLTDLQFRERFQTIQRKIKQHEKARKLQIENRKLFRIHPIHAYANFSY